MAAYLRKLAHGLRAEAWRAEFTAYKHPRSTLWFVFSAMLVLSAFWSNPWAWVVLFTAVAVYSASVGVLHGVVVGLLWAWWFVMLIEDWGDPLGGWLFTGYGLLCIGALMLLVVSKGEHD